MDKWIVSGSGETVAEGRSFGTTRMTIKVPHFSVEVTASSASQAHDLVVKTLTEAPGWRNFVLTGINKELS